MNNKSNITSWTNVATKQLLDAGITSARLDAELILAHTIRKGRTYIHAHGDEKIDSRYQDILDTRLALRLERVPLAYIIGHKEFYGRLFKVTPATLIPRPESETMITLLKEYVAQPRLPLLNESPRLVDVGTGSGCLGITAKLELPELDVTLTDTSRHALTVAAENAKNLKANVTTIKSDLLQNYAYKADYILANLPYVDRSWDDNSPELRHEPEEALYAANGGLALMYDLLDQARNRLQPNGAVFLEADLRQHGALQRYAKDRGFTLTKSRDLIAVFKLT